MPAVEVEPSAQQVLRRFVDDLTIGEVGLALLRPHGVRVAPEMERDPEDLRLLREVRDDEGVAAVREEDVRVLRANLPVDLLQDLGLAPAELDVPDAGAAQRILEARDAEGRVHRHIEVRRLQRRQLVVQRELLLRRPPLPVEVIHEPHGEDAVLEKVTLGEAQVDVEQLEAVILPVAVDGVREVLEVGIPPREDLEDGDLLPTLETDSPPDEMRLPDAVEDLHALAELLQVLQGRVNEERRVVGYVLDAVRLAPGPQPEDEAVLLMVRVGVEDPALHGHLPPSN